MTGLRNEPERLRHEGREPRHRETHRIEIEEVEGGVSATLTLEPFKEVKYTWIRGPKPNGSVQTLGFITAVLQDLDGAMMTYGLAVKDVEARTGVIPRISAQELINKTFVEARGDTYLSVRTIRVAVAHIEVMEVDTLIVHCSRAANLI